MPDTFTQIYVHAIFAVKNRSALIHPSFKDELYKYITGIVTNKNQKLLAINGMPDHVHILIGIKPDCALSDLIREIKKSSTQFIREKQFCRFLFSWQAGFGAFSCSKSQIGKVATYIENQETHHANQTFKLEYIDFLKKYDINYREEFLFDFFD